MKTLSYFERPRNHTIIFALLVNAVLSSVKSPVQIKAYTNAEVQINNRRDS